MYPFLHFDDKFGEWPDYFPVKYNIKILEKIYKKNIIKHIKYLPYNLEKEISQ